MTKELDEDITAGEGAYAELNGEPEPTQDESSSAEAETRPDGMPHTPRTRVTLDYKTTKIQENVDWESCKLKYSNIEDLFQEQYPRTDTGKDFPHGVGAITKAQLAAKLKQIRMKYRHAVDTKRRSGQGRVVHMFFELCEEVWGGSPATHTLSSGMETGDLEESSSGPSSPPSLERSNDSPQPESSESSGSLPAAAVVQHRRDLLQAKLNSHRSDRLKRKLPADHAVQEDIKIKKRMLELMEQTSIRNADSIQQMNASIVNITSTIQDGFSLMRELIQAHPHSSSGGYGQFQEHSPPFMHRRPHLATLAYTPNQQHPITNQLPTSSQLVPRLFPFVFFPPARLSSNQSRGKLRGQQLYGTGEGHKTQKAERGSGGTCSQNRSAYTVKTTLDRRCFRPDEGHWGHQNFTPNA
ncbi:hypothetical protein NQZ68_014924 [Dissostichus eleginoides]|nr:hypothetical protein NQZ68_014924 [Dissostichus eleginoides]